MTAQFDKAAADAKQISAVDHDISDAGGANGAYNKFQKDYTDYAKTHSATDTATYLKSLTADLVSNKTLPDLAVGWGAANRNRIGEGGNPNLFELSMVGNDRDPVDQVMAPVLSNEFKSVAGIGSGDTSRIHDSDWDAWSKQQQITNVDAGSIRTLMQTKDGSLTSSLFDYVDSIPGGNNDHKIDQDDFRRYIQKYEFDAKNHQLSAQETPENLATIKYLNDHWDDPAVQKLREHQPAGRAGFVSGAITLDSLTAAGNFSSNNDMLKAEKVVSQPQTTASQPTDSPVPAESLKTIETSAADVLAHDPNILNSVTDAHGNVSKTAVNSLLASMRPGLNLKHDQEFTDIYKSLTALENNWTNLSKQFSSDNGASIDLNKMTNAGFDGKQTFDDRLRRDGNEPLQMQDAARQELVAYCTSHPSFLADSNGIIRKDVIDRDYANGSGFSEQERKYIAQLHDSFSYLAGDNGTIDIHNFH